MGTNFGGRKGVMELSWSERAGGERGRGGAEAVCGRVPTGQLDSLPPYTHLGLGDKREMS